MRNSLSRPNYYLTFLLLLILVGSSVSSAEDADDIFIPYSASGSLGADEALKEEELEQKKINERLNVGEPIYSNKFEGPELGKLLINKNLYISENFKIFNDYSSFAKMNYYPKTRKAAVGHRDDLLHQRGLQIQINRGHIGKGTLILSDSGHDIPIAAQLLKNKGLKAQAFFYFPAPILKSPGTNDRLMNQSQSWAQDINYYQSISTWERPEVILIGLEGHRRSYDKSFLYEIPQNGLPTNEQLEKLGVSKVVYITEAHPDNPDVKSKVLKDIKKYLMTISLPIKYLGVDCRRDEGC